jgi:hypothetical protein
MARFVSANRGQIVTVQVEADEYMGPRGNLVPRKALIEAKFSHDRVTPADAVVAKLSKSQGGLANIDPKPDGSMPDSPFRGLTQMENGQFLPIETRLSVFDSEQAALAEGWDSETEDYVVEFLRARAGNDFVEVKAVAATIPWNGYDRVTDPTRMIEIAADIEADLATILQYEKENQDRADFISVLEEALVEEEDVVVTA